jgi:predicted phosphodiesterase
MRVALLSDPHGDHVALARVIADLEKAPSVDEVLLGGDLAQGGPQPVETIDEIRNRRWRSVRGNSDEFLIRIADGQLTEPDVPEEVMARGSWSVERLGTDGIEYLRALPTSIEVGPFPFGRVALVHATPWSTEDVVLPDAAPDVAQRMVDEAGARLLAYGHIHTPYQRKVGDAVLMSIGAVSASNDADPRPAYSIVTLGETISVEVRRVDWPLEERLADYEKAGVELDSRQRRSLGAAGPFPVRSQAGVAVTLWP